MGEIRYLQVGLEQVSWLVDSRVEFLTEYWGAKGQEETQQLRDELESFFRRELPAGTFVAWLAMDGDQWVGVGGMKLVDKPGGFRAMNGRSGYIMNMYTRSAWRKRGIATAILELLLEHGRQAGASYFELHATTDGAPVYERAGFVRHGEPTYRKFVQ